MNSAIVKTICRSVLLLAVTSVSLCAQAGIDKKFYKKTAEKVWKMDLPQFDAKKEIPDSIGADRAAVFIARYNGLTCNYDGSENAVKRVKFGRQNSSSMKITSVRRYMVKILTDASLEDFTEFGVRPSVKQDVSGYVIYEKKPAFGARIFKPDGRIVNVDMDEVLTVTSGKKGKKEEEYKIAIPGLEVGDVLDYFFYNDVLLEELRRYNEVFNIFATYPTLDFSVDIRCAPQLALEYGAYNGAPKQTSFQSVKGMNVIDFTLTDVDAINEKAPYYRAGRQMPYLDVFVFNNNALLSYVPSTARPGGIRHAAYHNFIRDVASALSKTKIEPKIINSAVEIAKQWIKAHPEASQRDIADAAYDALLYSIVNNGDNLDESREWLVAFYLVLEKIGFPGQYNLAVTSSRNKPSIDQLVDFDDATYLMLVDGITYFEPSSFRPIPGRLPTYYDQERLVSFDGHPNSSGLEVGSHLSQVRTAKAVENQWKSVIDASLADDLERVDLTGLYDMTGSKANDFYTIVSMFDGFDALSRFLGQKPVKILKGVDRKEYEDDLKELREQTVLRLWGGGEVKMTDFKVLSDGWRPDSADVVFEAKGYADGLVSMAGRNVMVNIGMLIGEQSQVTGSNRQREISVIMENPSRTDATIRFHIPNGYKLVDGALNDLNRSVITPEGSFNSEATVDGDTVKIRVIERYARSLYNASSWPNLLKVLDAAYEFNSASIVLQPL